MMERRREKKQVMRQTEVRGMDRSRQYVSQSASQSVQGKQSGRPLTPDFVLSVTSLLYAGAFELSHRIHYHYEGVFYPHTNQLLGAADPSLIPEVR